MGLTDFLQNLMLLNSNTNLYSRSSFHNFSSDLSEIAGTHKGISGAVTIDVDLVALAHGALHGGGAVTRLTLIVARLAHADRLICPVSPSTRSERDDNMKGIVRIKH